MAKTGGYQREAKYRDLWCRFRLVILDMYLRTLVALCQWPLMEIGIDCPWHGGGARIKAQERLWIPAGLRGVQGPCRAPRVDLGRGAESHLQT